LRSASPPPPQFDTLSLHDALPILPRKLIRTECVPSFGILRESADEHCRIGPPYTTRPTRLFRRGIHSCEGRAARAALLLAHDARDRKSTRLNSSHVKSSYAVFCLK